jgi:hypothetical protein
MSGSNRVNVSKTGLIIGLLLALAICIGWIGYGLSKSAEYERQADNKRSEYSEYTRQKIADTCVGMPDLEAVKCRYDAFDAQREYNSNQSDLIAQRQSALWAYIMGAAAVIGMALSAVGVWLVKATFDATREANVIQKTAMKNAEIDAKEARNALVESDRAVIIIPNSIRGRQEIDDTVSLYFSVENNGRTAAKAFEIAFSLSDEPVFRSRRTYVRRFNEMCLASQTLRFGKIQIKRRSIANKYVTGYVTYRAIHGVQFKTYFCYLAIVAANVGNPQGTDTYDLVKRSCKGLPANT